MTSLNPLDLYAKLPKLSLAENRISEAKELAELYGTIFRCTCSMNTVAGGMPDVLIL